MYSRTLILALAAVLPAWRVAAVEFRHDRPAVVPVHQCTCRFHGENVPLGEQRCLVTPDGPRRAECVLEQNVTSWRPSREPCPQA